jgi:hypothetical protein
VGRRWTPRARVLALRKEGARSRDGWGRCRGRTSSARGRGQGRRSSAAAARAKILAALRSQIERAEELIMIWGGEGVYIGKP